MRTAKFKKITPNYRKKVLEITLQEGKRLRKFNLPFAVFRDKEIDAKNRFESIVIDSELNSQGVEFVLTDGSRGDFPSDFVLYYCDPSYRWSPLNQLKKALKEKIKTSRLSVRVLADALNTSPSQVMRLFEENKASRQLLQLFQIAELAGYQFELSSVA